MEAALVRYGYPPKKLTNYISHMLLNVTDQCNFRCTMCFCEFKDNYMTEEIADRGIELALSRMNPSLKEKGEKLSVSFFGGEPLLNFKLIKYVVAKWKDECTFGITTNGSLLTTEILDFLKENNIQPLLSIDGCKEVQDRNRPLRSGGSSADKLFPMLPEILKRFPSTTFRSTVIPETCHLLYKSYKFAREQGFVNYFCTPDAYSNWTDEKIEELQKQVLLITTEVAEDILFGREPVIPQVIYEGIKDYFCLQTDFVEYANSPLRCGLGTSGFGVGASGTVVACQEHGTIAPETGDPFIIGNVWDGIDNEKLFKLNLKYIEERNFWKDHPEDYEECTDCPYRLACAGRSCPSRQSFMSGRFDNFSLADCIWFQIGLQTAKFLVDFFSENYSPNFELFLAETLNSIGLNLKIQKEEKGSKKNE